MEIRFAVNGNPVGKSRPRFTRNGHVYTDSATIDYETLVKESYIKKARGYKFSSPVRVAIRACFKVPKSKSKKVVEDMLCGRILPTKKPDIDNIAKIILDGLNKVAWDDDTQVSELVVGKMYGEDPCVMVLVEEMDARRC